MISGWSDWVASLQIITKNLQAIGINANTSSSSPTGTRGTRLASTTKAPTLLWQNASQGSPYGFFFSILSAERVHASGPGRDGDG